VLALLGIATKCKPFTIEMVPPDWVLPPRAQRQVGRTPRFAHLDARRFTSRPAVTTRATINAGTPVRSGQATKAMSIRGR
jgi:hypothetical protein